MDVAKLPAPGTVKPPSSREEAVKMIGMGWRLVTMAMEFKGSWIGERDRRVTQATIGAVMRKG